MADLFWSLKKIRNTCTLHQLKLFIGDSLEEKDRRMSAKYVEELPTTKEMVQKYKNKLEKCLRDYDGLNKSLTA